jgi:hypothetical protein
MCLKVRVRGSAVMWVYRQYARHRRPARRLVSRGLAWIWVKKDGQLLPIEKQERVLPWWRLNADGSYVFFVRSSGKPIEFEKGKNAVAVFSLDKIPLLINLLITAVRNGELDVQLAPTRLRNGRLRRCPSKRRKLEEGAAHGGGSL